MTCVQVSHYIDAGSNRHSTVDEGRAGLDTQILVIKEHPPAPIVTQTKSQIKHTIFWIIIIIIINSFVILILLQNPAAKEENVMW